MEIWRDIPGYVGAYQVSNRGRVRSLTRVVCQKNGVNKRRVGQLLKPGAAQSGHLSVVLGRGNTFQVHALVLLAFVGPYPKNCEILHKDHNPANNTRRNLRYGTRSENITADYIKGNRSKAVQVTAHFASGATRTFRTVTSAAKACGLTQSAVSYLLKSSGTSRKRRIKFSTTS